MPKDNTTEEQRKQRRLQALGTNTPRCALCGEDRWQTLEQHHPGGQAYDASTFIVCRNCHRVLSDTQRNHPGDANSPDPELMAIGRFLLGLADALRIVVEKLVQFGLALIERASTPPTQGETAGA